jgi:hypothetical protein
MKNLFALVLLVAAGAASATTPVAVTPTPVTQTQSQSSEQAQSAVAQASLIGNKQVVEVKQVKQAPSVYAAQTNTTAKCARAVGGGLSVAGFGISGGTAIRDKDCRLAEAAEYELAQGNKNASIALRCRISFYKEAFGDTCVAKLNEVVADQPSLSREQVREALSGSK